ncbi:MAG: hypothetical protein CMP67_07165 [Flavobacteriales bacterium]|nr:hypothetical protein [Flavobacteriales bacterium]
MIRFSFILSIVFVLFSCRNKPSYSEIIESKRDFIESSFLGPNSPLLLKDKERFSGLSYYGVDSNYRVHARVVWDLNAEPIYLNRDTMKSSLFFPSAILKFSLGSDSFNLTGYTRSLQAKGNIFIPFYDLTSGKETYAGGRFLDVVSSDNKWVILDFNLSYNPSCAYNPKYICPVPPFSNDLKVHITAGEKKPSFLSH